MQHLTKTYTLLQLFLTLLVTSLSACNASPDKVQAPILSPSSSLDGTSFLENVYATTQSWNPAVDAPIDGSGLQFIGDYQGLAADNFFAHPFWNDARTGRQELFTVAVPSIRS